MGKNCRKTNYLLILDVLFCCGRSTIDDIEKEFPDKARKQIQLYLRELAKLNLVIIQREESDIETIRQPRNFYSLKCNCPLPGETDNCESCPAGKVIRDMQNSVR